MPSRFRRFLCYIGFHEVFDVEFTDGEIAHYCEYCDWDPDVSDWKKNK